MTGSNIRQDIITLVKINTDDIFPRGRYVSKDMISEDNQSFNGETFKQL